MEAKNERIPKRIYIAINGMINASDVISQFDEEYFIREGFSKEEICNITEKYVRENIWQYVKENDIKILVE